VRWTHPTLGPVDPGTFVPLAEETGFVVPLGRWVLQTACRAAAGWAGRAVVAVNVSARQLADPDLVADVTAAVEAAGLSPARLVLEVTESAVMADVAAAAETLGALRGFGVRIAIDDFGTGHASLAHLRDLPVDVLKIDRSFVTPLGTSDRASAFVEAIIGLARSLGMSTVAEGVESAEQYDILCRLGCDTVQGFLTGRPLAPSGTLDLTAVAAGTPGPHWETSPRGATLAAP
jgi:diguanylate cyclase